MRMAMTAFVFPVLFALTTSAPAAVGDREPGPEALPFERRASAERPLCFDEPGDGSIWVRGRTYKAAVNGERVEYVPFLGSDAPRNFPLALSLASATVAGERLALAGASVRRVGQDIAIDRGTLSEHWTFALDSAEQTFHFAELGQRGAIELRVAWTSELEPATLADGFTYSNELGGVRYGRATAIDAGGRRLELESHLDGGEIVILVPADFVATAELPLVVDPVVSTFAIDNSTFRDFYAQSAYDATNDRWLVVYQDAFSVTDFDVYSELLSSTGGFVAGAYVDATSAVWFVPSVANLNATDTFLAVGTTGDIASGTNRRIFGRITGAGALAYGTAFDISGTQTDYNLYAEAGGDPYATTPSYFCVAWPRDVAGVRQIAFRNVTSTGTFVQSNPVVLDSYFAAKDAAVSKGNGGTNWTITWGRCPASAGNCDIWAAQVQWDGVVTTPAFALTTTASAEYAAKPSSPSTASGSYMVVWQLDRGAHHDIEAAVCLGGTVLARANLTELEAVDVLENQRLPDVDADGDRFVVTYHESFNGSSFDTDPYVASFVMLGGAIAVAEAHRDLAFTSAKEENVTVASRYSTGGAIGRALCTWHDQASLGAQEDIHGGFYEPPAGGYVTGFCFGDGSGTACPCGNSGTFGRGCAHSTNASGALLSALGSAQASNDTLTLFSTGMPSSASCLFFQGSTPSNSGLGSVFGDGLRCAAGSVIRLGTKTASAGSASYPVGADLDVSVRGAVPLAGAVRYYQAWFRNAAAFCTSSTFNLSNGLRVTWLP